MSVCNPSHSLSLSLFLTPLPANSKRNAQDGHDAGSAFPCLLPPYQNNTNKQNTILSNFYLLRSLGDLLTTIVPPPQAAC